MINSVLYYKFMNYTIIIENYRLYFSQGLNLSYYVKTVFRHVYDDVRNTYNILCVYCLPIWFKN